MDNIPLIQLAGARFQQALTVFRDMFVTEVDTRMRAYFGDNYIAHLESINTVQRIIDFDEQRQPRFDANALMFLLLEDGGLRSRPAKSGATAPMRYVPHIFAFEEDRKKLALPPSVWVLPNRSHLIEVRQMRNAWAHQQPVSLHDMRKVVNYLLVYVRILPESTMRQRAIHELELCSAYMRVYDVQQLIDSEVADVAHKVMAQQQHTITALHTQLTDVRTSTIPAVDARIDTLQRDQNLLLTGIMESLADVQHLSEAEVTRLRSELAQLRELTSMYARLQQTLHDALHVVSLQHDTIGELQQQVDGLRLVVASHTVKTSPLIHQPASITAKAPVLQDITAPPTAQRDARTPWRTALFVLLTVACGAALWLQAAIATWIQHTIP